MNIPAGVETGTRIRLGGEGEAGLRGGPSGDLYIFIEVKEHALFQREGYAVVSVPVNHRQRTRGTSKYGLHNRLWVGIVDLFGVMWLIRRASPRIRIDEDA